MSEGESAREMPRYQSHKKVWALKIAAVAIMGDLSATITPADEGYAPFNVTSEYVQKNRPQPGGYFVVYDDGYQSFSPAGPFEKGYTRL